MHKLASFLLLLASCVQQAPLAPPPHTGKRAPAGSLWFGGDVHLGSQGGPLFAELPPPLRGTLGVVNLEGPVGREPPRSQDNLLLWNHPDGLGALRDASVRVVGIANNHAGDLGPSGPAQTTSLLEQQGFLVAAHKPALLNLVDSDGPLRVAITAHDLSGSVPNELGADLALARSQADVLITTFHTTGPPSYLPSSRLQEAAERALSLGALVVIAHGSHALAKVERRGTAVIAWGLGNLRFRCKCTEERDALLLRVLLRRVDKSVRAEAAVLPITAGLLEEPAQLAVKEEGAALLDLLGSLGSSPLRLDEQNLATF